MLRPKLLGEPLGILSIEPQSFDEEMDRFLEDVSRDVAMRMKEIGVLLGIKPTKES